MYFWLAAEQQNKGAAVEISYRELAESIGVSKSSAHGAVSWLIRRKLLVLAKRNSTAVPRYTVLSPWKEQRHGPRS